MRLSNDPNDTEAFAAFEHHRGMGKILVYLDDVEIKDVGKADEEAGTIERLCRDAEGNIRFENGEFITETLTGKVRIEIVDK